MKKLIIIAIILSAHASALLAQSGATAAPVATPDKTRFIVGEVTEHRNDPFVANDQNQVRVTLWNVTAATAHPNQTSDVAVIITTLATIGAFEDARAVTAPGENASGVPRENFRVLTWLKANTATAGVTIQCNDSTLTPAQCVATISGMTVGTT
jgi:hypothetical protein